jgi:hypothetical protein
MLFSLVPSNQYTPLSEKRWCKEVIMETLLILLTLIIVG